MFRLFLKITIFIVVCLNTPVVFAFSTVNPIISAWLPSWDFENATKTLKRNTDLFSEISPFWYYLNDDGSIGLSKGSEDPEFVNLAHQTGFRIIPSITNSFKDARASQVMADEEKRNAFVKVVMDKVRTHNYDGIDIDFEGLKLANKDNFIALLKSLATELHKEGKMLTAAIQAKTEAPGPWESVQSQDWKKIGEIVDRFRIMGYDKHYSGGSAGAIAPVPWIKDILEFAKTQIPAEKLILGMPLYGYNWGEKEKTYSVTFEDAEYLLGKYKPTIQWNDTDKEAFFIYDKPLVDKPEETEKRTVYFQNKDSIENKWKEASSFPVFGVAFWRLGAEDQSVWQLLRDQKKSLLKTGNFNDVSESHWAFKYIQTLREFDLSQGVNNNFFPEKNLTRAEALKIVLKAGQIPATNYPAVSRFKDSKKTDWFDGFIHTGKAWSIVSGQGDKFFPFNTISRSEALKIIQKSGGKKSPDSVSRPNDPISRAEFAKLVSVSFAWL
ncbi:MAG: hypothetical protein A2V81_03260 [Candidatus Abawacabacteria bacterium RBG_16_42_10]|uniref:GH18 domain-containing protein n=1 Tax=Candidatus Abawacabacteria bacterium RBG_16_42_10 TaxID=1817814 RepID=A0A1F4XKJ4_9BACT|nr:MAG: hypothetical protein A2V81_03260 [Candidatus Abawacabacteria bacterium RBG_16_42_10]